MGTWQSQKQKCGVKKAHVQVKPTLEDPVERLISKLDMIGIYGQLERGSDIGKL